MRRIPLIFAAILTTCLYPALTNAEGTMSVGGDVYAGDSKTRVTIDVPRDLFAAGYSSTINGDVAQDAHVTGFDVDVDGRIGSDLYAVGATVNISSSIQEDLTASGFTVNVKPGASVAGNARISGGSVTVDAPIKGSLIASGGNITINSSIDGDVRLTAPHIDFGEEAKIGGILTYSSSSEIEVPASIVTADRIRYVPFSRTGMVDDIRRTVDKSARSIFPFYVGKIISFAVVLSFLLIVAALFFSFQQDRIDRLQTRAVKHTGLTLVAGFLGLATLFGLIPASAITLVGLPLIPIVILLIIVLWTLGYLLGAYVLSLRLNASFREPPNSTGSRVMVLAAGLIGLALINFIPIVGWLFNLFVMFLGLGSITLSFTHYLSHRDTVGVGSSGDSHE